MSRPGRCRAGAAYRGGADASAAGLGLVHLNQGDLEEAERTAEEARALAIDAGLGREVGEASAILGLVASAQGRWNDLFGRVHPVGAADTGLVPFVFDAHLCNEFSLHSVEDATRSFPPAGLLTTSPSRRARTKARRWRLLGEVELLSGGLEQAAEYLARAVELHEQARAPSGQALSMERMAAVALARGQRWHADRLLQRALRLAAASRLAPPARARPRRNDPGRPDLPRSVAAVQRADAALTVTCARRAR